MTPPPVNFYADLQGIAPLRGDARARDPAALKEAARQFESLFTQMLLRSMREANRSFGASMFGSDQQDFYQDMFDGQIAMQLSQGGGLGLADMLVQQLARENLAGAPGAGQARDARAGAPAGAQASVMSAPGAGAATSGTARVDGPARDGPSGTSKSEFVRTMWPHARQAARELGVDPHALLAQAALETGWGRHMPCRADGRCSFNLFGIKAGSQWSGDTVQVPTLEIEQGIPVRRVERFRAYASAAESFRDYAALIRGNARYEDALGTGADVASFAAALQRGGYATDPRYAQKIVAVANEVRVELEAGSTRPATSEVTRNG